MVAPRNGPFLKQYTYSVPRYCVHDYNSWYRQKAPWTLSCAWTRFSRQSSHGYGGSGYSYIGGLWSAFASSTLPPNGNIAYFRNVTTAFDEAYNRAFNRLVNKLQSGASASIGTAIGEAEESFKMIINRLKSLTAAARNLKRGNIIGFWRSLNIDQKGRPRPKKQRIRNDAAGIWLEYSFGWAPMISDIFDALNVLQAPIPKGRFRARSANTSGQETLFFAGQPAFCNWSIGVTLACLASVSNPNLFLANQLGLVNPVQVAWNLIPFSFLVDWFLPVGSFLNSFTAFWGLTLENCSITRIVNFRSRNYVSYPYWIDERGFRVQRDLVANFPTPKLNLRLPGLKGLAGKAASLTALAVNILSSLKR